MRLFFAIELPREVKDRIAELESDLRPRLRSARWVSPANVHLTLRFLGETNAEVAERIGGRLREELETRVSFALKFQGVGAFPNPVRPRVLWVGTLGAPEALFELQSLVEETVRTEGFPPETRAFEPHLTIARFRHRERGLGALLAPMENRSLGEMKVAELVCFESHLSPAGASYSAQGRFEIGGRAGII
jgi:2'-5' RNA ligase